MKPFKSLCRVLGHIPVRKGLCANTGGLTTYVRLYKCQCCGERLIQPLTTKQKFPVSDSTLLFKNGLINRRHFESGMPLSFRRVQAHRALDVADDQAFAI